MKRKSEKDKVNLYTYKDTLNEREYGPEMKTIKTREKPMNNSLKSLFSNI